jgi:hypothetical protein
MPQRSDESPRVIRLKSIGRCLPEGIDLQLAATSRALQHIQPKIAARSRAVKSSCAQIALKSLAYNTKKFFKESTWRRATGSAGAASGILRSHDSDRRWPRGDAVVVSRCISVATDGCQSGQRGVLLVGCALVCAVPDCRQPTLQCMSIGSTSGLFNRLCSACPSGLHRTAVDRLCNACPSGPSIGSSPDCRRPTLQCMSIGSIL